MNSCIHPYVIQDNFRRHYRLHLLGDASIHSTIEPERFSDPVLTEHFVRHLRVPLGYWQRMLLRTPARSFDPNVTIEARISQLLMQGVLKLYPIKHLNNRPGAASAIKSYPVIAAGKELRYQLVPVSVLLVSSNANSKTFDNKAQAVSFLTSLNLDDAQLSALAEEVDIPRVSNGQNIDKRIAIMAQALLDRKVVVLVQQQPVTRSPESSIEGVPAQGGGGKSMSLGPHEESDGVVKAEMAISERHQYKTTTIDKAYQGENNKKNPDRWNDPFVCEYLEDDDERKIYEIGVKDGMLIHLGGPNIGRVFDTSDGSTHWGGGGAAIFVMSGNGRIYASKTHEPMLFHHSSFLAGGSVASAGELIVENGKLVEISNQSGHYKPKKELNEQLITELENKGISRLDLNDVRRSGV